MIYFVRSRNSRVERANLTLLSRGTMDFIDDTLSYANHPPSEYEVLFAEEFDKKVANIASHDLVAFCGQVRIPSTRTLNDLRGFVGRLQSGHRFVHTFDLQDAQDHRNIEGQLDDTEDDETENKDSAPTRWTNYRFWVREDIRKLVAQPEIDVTHPLIQCSADDMISYLRSIKNYSVVYFDIETRLSQMTCFSIKATQRHDDDPRTRSYLVRNFANHLCRGALEVVAQLAKLLTNRTLIWCGHNLSYDLAFLTLIYGLPLPARLWDTMCSHHRLYPEADKSLAHVISLYSNHINHKVNSINETHSVAQDGQLLLYNSQDVQVLETIHRSQLTLIAGDRGLSRSVNQVNELTLASIEMGLIGFRVDETEQLLKQMSLQRQANNLQKIANVLCGRYTFELSSPAQVVKYFHQVLGYKQVAKTDKGAASLRGDALYDLAMHYNNPMIRIVIEFRETMKELTGLNFTCPPSKT